MNEPTAIRSNKPRFSLLNLLALTALIAIGTAIALAYFKNRSMVQERDALLSLSSRLQIDNVDELAMSGAPKVADDFNSWNVHVPTGKDHELRLGLGEVSEDSIPPVWEAVQIPAGQHRVTLHASDSPPEGFRYVVYVDGEQVMDKEMGEDWMPGGWSSASSIGWPSAESQKSTPMQLAARSYEPRVDVGSGNYFNGHSDDYVTRNGYRLWIDQADRTYQPASPFMGFATEVQYHGIGFRDGLRYKPYSRSPYAWTFTCPRLCTSDAVLQLSVEFYDRDGVILSSQTPSFQAWQLHDDALGTNKLNWQRDPTQSEYSAFLKAVHKTEGPIQPVVQFKWDSARPDEVGLRIANTPANEQVSRWRLRILDGTKHLWREMQVGERTLTADEFVDATADGDDGEIALALGKSASPNTQIHWQTNESLPLQVLERKQSYYAGMGLYKGLPLAIGLQIPDTLNPRLSAIAVDEDPVSPGKTFPGGAVFDEVRIDLDATHHDWIWIETKPK